MDHTTFFVTDVAQVAPAVDTFTRNSAKGLSPDALRQTLVATIDEAMQRARATDQGKVGSGLLRADAPGRADAHPHHRDGVHGLDLECLTREGAASDRSGPAGLAAQLEELLQHRRGIARPSDLHDDIAFIEIATGRRPHADAHFPILQ